MMKELEWVMDGERLVSLHEHKEVLNEEETDEDVADKMSPEVASRDGLTHIVKIVSRVSEIKQNWKH